MPKYFFTSDTHFGNEKILEHCKRPFKNVEKMNEALIENWNKTVSPTDYIYHLGDFGSDSLIDNQDIFNQLHGRKYLIRGNHDYNYTLPSGWVWVKDTAMINIGDQYIWLSHYPHRLWNRAGQGVWHLFGHVHRNKAEYWLSFNVGVDAWDFKPISLEKITKHMGYIHFEQTCVEQPFGVFSEYLVGEEEF